jgi:hypothetical protein
MKVRIQSNSIRFRLKENETEILISQGKLSEVLELGADSDQTLSFTLQAAKSEVIRASVETNNIVFYIPQHLVEYWVQNNEVGFNEDIDVSKGKKLKLLVEKDFPCDHESKPGKESGIQFH